MFCYIFAHTVEISCKTIKTAKNTLSDICAQNSRRNEFCDFLAHTVVLSHKTVKSAKNTICDICDENSRRYEFPCYFCLYSCNKS